MLKESALAKEAISVFSGFRPSYNKGDVNGVTRSLGFFERELITMTKSLLAVA